MDAPGAPLMYTLQQVIAISVLALIISGLIARSRRPSVPVWSIMALASAITVLTGLEPFNELGYAIDLDVVLFLIGMFSLVSLAEESGLLSVLAMRLVSRTKSIRGVFILTSLAMGLLAAFAVNDTVALMGPPIVYSMAKVAQVDPAPLFLVLAFAVTIGSTMTPMGNPQNLLIAIESGMPAPFIAFLATLAIPTVVNLVVTPLIVMRMHGVGNRELKGFMVIPEEQLKNKRDALIAGVFLATTIVILVGNDVLELAGIRWIEHRGFIPFVMASLAYIFTSNPRRILARVDWGTIVFFITMFITMDGVWRSGVLQSWLSIIMPGKPVNCLVEYSVLTAISLFLSQLLSNVPFVKLFIDYMKTIGYTGGDTRSWLILAMGSTIAGNLTLLGAASNIIILEVLESRYDRTISFTEFLKTGVVVTAANIAVYTPFLLA